MADPRLNSVHLESSRRQDYRRARDQLLNARGWQTLAAEGSAAVASDPHTINDELPAAVPKDLKYWLLDRDYVYPLRTGLNTVGRSPENDVVVKDAYVSRRHCAILVHAGETCELHDTASKNGTFLNGRKLSGPTRLNPGDEIRMCDCQFVFLSKDEGDLPGHAPTQAE